MRPSSAVEHYRHQSVDFRQAAAELHVDTLLTGKFLRDGEDLRITSQLIDVKTQNILWKGAFDLKYDKLLTVQDSVAQQIEYGFAGDVGTLPPIDHRLQGVGISVPKCFNESREGESCSEQQR